MHANAVEKRRESRTYNQKNPQLFGVEGKVLIVCMPEKSTVQSKKKQKKFINLLENFVKRVANKCPQKGSENVDKEQNPSRTMKAKRGECINKGQD